MKGSILTHFSWALFTLVTFFAGSKLAGPSKQITDQGLMSEDNRRGALRVGKPQLLNALGPSKDKSSGPLLDPNVADDLRPRGLASRKISNSGTVKSSAENGFMNQNRGVYGELLVHSMCKSDLWSLTGALFAMCM